MFKSLYYDDEILEMNNEYILYYLILEKHRNITTYVVFQNAFHTTILTFIIYNDMYFVLFLQLQ